jgi:hypothetical protein
MGSESLQLTVRPTKEGNVAIDDEDLPASYLLYVVAAFAVIAGIAVGVCVLILR